MTKDRRDDTIDLIDWLGNDKDSHPSIINRIDCVFCINQLFILLVRCTSNVLITLCNNCE